MNKYELALAETQSVLSEWMATDPGADERRLAQRIVERLIAKGVIQSTDPEDLRDYRRDAELRHDAISRMIEDDRIANPVEPEPPKFRTGPLEPGQNTVGGS